MILTKAFDEAAWGAIPSLDEYGADAGEFMPPKSTWFEPKLRSGLFLHQFDVPEFSAS